MEYAVTSYTVHSMQCIHQGKADINEEKISYIHKS